MLTRSNTLNRSPVLHKSLAQSHHSLLTLLIPVHVVEDSLELTNASMAATPKLRILFFDVFGTCVSQSPSVADELFKATREALESSSSSMSGEVRANAEKMVRPLISFISNKLT